MNNIIFFSDIDDTLIYSKRKIDFTKDIVIGAYDKNNQPYSYFYKETKLLIDLLINAGIIFIPNTARNLESYKRTVFYKDNKIRYAILNFGATILVDNKIDKEWNNHIINLYKDIDLNHILDDIQQYFSFNIDIKIVDNYYISIHNRYFKGEKNIYLQIHAIVKKFIKHKPFDIYINTDSVAIFPNFIGKEKATQFLISKLNPNLIIGAGDSKSDINFINLSDLAIFPTKSNILQDLPFK